MIMEVAMIPFSSSRFEIPVFEIPVFETLVFMKRFLLVSFQIRLYNNILHNELQLSKAGFSLLLCTQYSSSCFVLKKDLRFSL